MNDSQADQEDVVILGGGLAGLSLALHCRKLLPQARIAVLEKRRHPAPEATFKVGESTVEAAANYFGSFLGLRQHLEEEQLPKLGLRFFFPAGDNAAIEDRFELGGRRYAPAPSYQLDRGRFENYLVRRCVENDIRFQDQARVTSIQLGRGKEPHQIGFERHGALFRRTCRWVADASGRRALLKRQLGLQKESRHLCNAAWFRVKGRVKVDEWSHDDRWRAGHCDSTARWYSTNHLMGEGYWVWLIPLASDFTSIGIVAAEEMHPLSEFNSMEKALRWLERHEPQCAIHLQERRDQIQDFLAIKHYAVECTQVFSANRWGVTGEAGFFLDPFYSPGSDFIAFSNTFLADLIERDLTGRAFRWRAFAYDGIFKKLFYGTFAAYQDQYPLFGNAQVMPIKILWDYLIYWSISCFLYMHGRLCHPTVYLRHLAKLKRLGEMNHCLQECFRHWHRKSPAPQIRGSIDISSIAIIRQKNEELLSTLDNRQFAQQFAANVAQMETLFWEILDHAGLDAEVPFRRRRHPGAMSGAFDDVFREISHGMATAQAPVLTAAT